MSETADRLFLYAAAMDIEPPVLTHEDGDLLITDALVDFCRSEGINLDWALTGKAITPLSPELRAAFDHLSPDENARLLIALKAHLAGMDLDAALRQHFHRD